MPAQPPLGSSSSKLWQLHRSFTPPGFSTSPASPTEVDHGLLRIPGACYVAVNDLEKQRPEGVDDNGDLVLRYLHMGHN